MVSMTAVRSDAAPGGRFTRADWEATPDDGRRYELLDGALVVTPSPGVRHQRLVGNLFTLLRDLAPAGTHAYVAPLDAFLPTGDILEPDVLVVPDSAVRDDKVQAGVPVLVVEVISPSSRRRDLGDKLTAYRDAGVPAYWVVDPDGPRLRAWALEDGEYVEQADVTADDEWTATEPFPVTVRPSDLAR